MENAVITVGDEEYSIQFGQWRLHKEIPQEIKDTFSSPGLSAFGSRGGGARNEGPSTDGYVKNAVFFDLTIEEPLTLLGIRQMETEVDEFAIKDIKVEYYEYKDEEKVLVMDFLWDASRPLNLDKGEIVRISCDLQDPRFMEFEYCYTPVFFLDYEVRNREYSVSAISNYMKRDDGLGLNGWMRYFLHFEGIDIGEYYYYLSNYVSPEDYLEP